ncbi:ABC transporter ATP-binding protein [Patescibacteria group bacterium]|nr:ABC transporter ATP-binding protein [Patescibacteria group bacterium]
MSTIIGVQNLKKHFGKVKAIDGISFEVEKGEIFGFLGPNGAGKTTTIRCMMDFIRPSEGNISILDKDAHKDDVWLKKKIGYLSGQVKLYDKWTGRMHIDFVSKLNGKTDIAKELIKKLDFDPNRKTKHLSSGNRQKLGLIMSFMCEPDVLIFDEPTNALDPLLQNTVYDMIADATKRGATVFMSSHNLAEVQRICDRVGIIKEGKMAAIESIVSLKEKRINTVRVLFANKVDPKEFEIEGVEVNKKFDQELVLQVKGGIDKLVKILAKHTIRDLEVTEATLEDIFLEYYE